MTRSQRDFMPQVRPSDVRPDGGRGPFLVAAVTASRSIHRRNRFEWEPVLFPMSSSAESLSRESTPAYAASARPFGRRESSPISARNPCADTKAV